MDRATVDTYERRAAEWVSKRSPHSLEYARAFGATLSGPGWRADLGCGPGWYTSTLGEPVVAILIRLNRTRPRPIAFDDIEIV